MEPFSEYSIMFYSITLCAGIYVTFAQFIQRKVGNPEKVKEIQQEISLANKRYQEALKSKDDEKIKKAEKEQMRAMKMSFEPFKYSLPPLLVIIPVFLVASAFLRGQYPMFDIELPFAIPVPVGLLAFTWRSIFGALGWFVVSAFFIGMLAYFTSENYKKIFKKNENKEKK